MRGGLAIVPAVLIGVLIAGCGGKDRPREASSALQVGLVFDVGGIGDKSFNDSAYRGLLKARDELKVGVEYLEPAEGTDREAALRQMAAGTPALIFGIGALFTDDVNAVAKEFPKKEFACVDYVPPEQGGIPENLLGLKFREQEGCFLVGAVAGLVTKTGTVGFVGGMDNALIHRFEAGYRAGVAAVNPGCRILSNYAGVTANAYKNPAKGKELALAQYDAGADIIFHASGSTGLGVFEAARDRDRLAIGVDSDQQAEAPGHILTSMIKRIDVAVFDAIRDAQQGKFAGGVREMGLAEGALDYVYDDNNKVWITDDVRAKVEALRAEILAGRIQVPTR
jgi:basic membrane protein A and related proteins